VSTERLRGIVNFQARVIQFAEELIDCQGLTAAYRRALYAALVREVERGEADYPADLMAAAYNAAHCNGLPAKPAGPLPLDDYLSEVKP
jgi:hypothetical protein